MVREFNVVWKAECGQLNLAHATKNNTPVQTKSDQSPSPRHTKLNIDDDHRTADCYLSVRTCRTSAGVSRQVRGPELGPQ